MVDDMTKSEPKTPPTMRKVWQSSRLGFLDDEFLFVVSCSWTRFSSPWWYTSSVMNTISSKPKLWWNCSCHLLEAWLSRLHYRQTLYFWFGHHHHLLHHFSGTWYGTWQSYELGKSFLDCLVLAWSGGHWPKWLCHPRLGGPFAFFQPL